MSYQECMNFIEGTSEIAVSIRLLIAAFCGCMIGWERIAKRHSAGIKTFALVSLGAAVATSLNLYLAMLPEVNSDVARIPAAVVSGIGFLGAGTILVTGRKQIKGLTTAASLWVTACMGMAIGAGYLVIGLVCFVLVLIANGILNHLSRRVEEHSQYMSIYFEVEKSHGVTKLLSLLNEQNYAVTSMNKTKEKTLRESDVALLVDLDLNHHANHLEIMKMFNEHEFINYAEEI
ncbi:MAG: MgtC/SapB family protein [Lachnospiraceae bacterium]|nr:MgtC/SapB family protein [Lachnospiraceae bacterium]